jgi:hypothetical protein
MTARLDAASPTIRHDADPRRNGHVWEAADGLMAAMQQATDALRLGVRMLYVAGARITEIVHLSQMSPATVKRYTRGLALGEAPRGGLDHEARQALVAYWVMAIDRGRRAPAVTESSWFLHRFCPRCVAAQPAPARIGGAQPLGRLDRLPWWAVEEALACATRLCAAGVRPCVSGPLRYAMLCQLLQVSPWAAYEVYQRVSPHDWWLRPCPQCGRIIASESRSRRLCRYCR